MKNTSTGSINLLKVDQLWYDKSTPRKLVSSATSYYRKPFLPGEIIDVELRAPLGAAPPDINHADVRARQRQREGQQGQGVLRNPFA